MQIQDEGKSVPEATIGMQVAISMREPTVGRDFNEGNELYVAVPEADWKRLMAKHQKDLSTDDVETLKELIEIMRKKNPIWGL